MAHYEAHAKGYDNRISASRKKIGADLTLFIGATTIAVPELRPNSEKGGNHKRSFGNNHTC